MAFLAAALPSTVAWCSPPENAFLRKTSGLYYASPAVQFCIGPRHSCLLLDYWLSVGVLHDQCVRSEEGIRGCHQPASYCVHINGQDCSFLGGCLDCERMSFWEVQSVTLFYSVVSPFVGLPAIIRSKLIWASCVVVIGWN
jgi:hypothetical protein